jgi:hypothetical protein
MHHIPRSSTRSSSRTDPVRLARLNEALCRVINPGRRHPPGTPAHRPGSARLPGPGAGLDRLNPDYGVPADTQNPYGKRTVQDREAALALGTRVAVAASRENDPNPVMWLAGQDYRAADATRTAHLQHVRQRRGPERLGPER